MGKPYIGLDGHIYIRLYGTVIWRSEERVPQDVLDSIRESNKPI